MITIAGDMLELESKKIQIDELDAMQNVDIF